MVGRRKTASVLPPRMYAYKGKRKDTYYTITSGNERVNLGHDLLKAKRKLLELEEGHSIAGTIGELLDDYLKEIAELVKVGKRSQSTLDSNKLEIVQLKKAFGSMKPKDLKPPHVWSYLHKFRGKESPVRANREVSFLQAAFNMARSQGIVEDNPCVGVERNEEEARTRLVNDIEMAGLIKFCRENKHLGDEIPRKGSDAGLRVALAARLAYLTSKAQGQILRLHKSQIGDDGITFCKRKRGAPTMVLWTPALRETVNECLALPSKVTSMYLIHNRHGQPYTSSGFKSMWKRIMNKWIEAGNEHFTFHDIRAKSTTDLIEDGRKASELTGHLTESIPAKVYDRRTVRRAKAVR